MGMNARLNVQWLHHSDSEERKSSCLQIDSSPSTFEEKPPRNFTLIPNNVSGLIIWSGF